jgi:hypothetical protein
MLRRIIVAAAVLATVAAIVVWRSLPPKQLALASTFSDGTIPGILHVHSLRSDGRGTPEQIAHAAARAGLKFVVITDHGDATRTPDPPVYREGVLCLDAVEISTRDGHYVGMEIPAAPYPLGGEARDVVDDVKRLGGFGVAAHPDSPKPELQWRAWSAPFDAIEILNLDTMWRRRMAEPGWRGKAALDMRLLTYAVRPRESIASLVLRSTALERWDAIARRRHVALLSGADAHGQIAWRASDPIQARLSVQMPSYESVFGAMSVRLRVERALTGDAKVDASMVFRAIREGHLYTAIDGVAAPPEFEFTATNALGTVRMGDQLAVAGPVTLHVRSNAPEGFATTIWNGATAVVADRREQDFSVTMPADPAVYWVEIRADGTRATIPWITSNPVYVRAAEAAAATPARPPATTSTALFDGRSTAGWHIESDANSLGAFDVAPSVTSPAVLRLRFGLASTPATNQFVALAVDTPQGVAPNDRLTFAARAERPMRISVQLRTGQSRWARSVYVDSFSLSHTIFFDEFRPVEESTESAVALADVKSVLFVVDATNTKPSASGRLWITEPTLQKP